MDNAQFKRSRALLAFTLLAVTAGASHAADLSCSLKFSTKGWSAVYKRADGSGTVTCDDGTSMDVKIKMRGGGLTVGKSEIDDGTGKFTHVLKIGDVLGAYAQTEAHAGALKSATAQVLTKGTVSLALSGTGEGIDLGVSVGRFTIEKAK